MQPWKRCLASTAATPGIKPCQIAIAQEDGDTPEQFAKWFGEKYDLTLLPEGAL